MLATTCEIVKPSSDPLLLRNQILLPLSRPDPQHQHREQPRPQRRMRKQSILTERRLSTATKQIPKTPTRSAFPNMKFWRLAMSAADGGKPKRRAERPESLRATTSFCYKPHIERAYCVVLCSGIPFGFPAIYLFLFDDHPRDVLASRRYTML